MSSAAAKQFRTRLIGKVHLLAKQFKMDDGDRRSLMQRVTGKTSCSKMNITELGEVISAIEGGSSSAPSNKFEDPLKRKVQALWISLWNLGAVRNRKDAALNNFIEKQVGKSALRFTVPADDRRIVEALKSWAQREAQVDWENHEDERTAVMFAQVAIIEPGAKAYDFVKARFGLKTHWIAISNKFQNHIIRELGKDVRKMRSSDQEAKDEQ